VSTASGAARPAFPSPAFAVPDQPVAAAAERCRADDEQVFEAFARQHMAGLSRLGYLLTGDHSAADDLTADTLIAAWNQWDRVLELDRPAAYLRRIMINISTSRVRSSIRERRRIRLFHADLREARPDPDGAVVVDVQEALRHLPVRRRACVVLRHAFDLSEDEVARIMRVSVGTVKSQTSRGMAQLQRLLAAGDDDD
jgi:RNA polymerase sigma-70 factor (sigma-E family)